MSGYFLQRSGGWPRVLMCWLALLPLPVMAQDSWTLEDSIQRAMEHSPELAAATAQVRARESALRQASVWPNPAIEMRADDKIGIDDGSGGSDLTQLAISQPLPVTGRLGLQQSVADEELLAARADYRNRKLALEAEVARRFHALQLASARLTLAGQHLQLADELQQVGRRREQAGELSRLERLRLDLVRESAQQKLDKAEGRYNEALGYFRVYLALPETAAAETVELKPYAPLPDLEALRNGLSEHPALVAADHRLSASRKTVDLTRAEILPDPVLSLFRERDYLNDRRSDITGIGLSVTLPLWDRGQGRLGQARARVEETRFDGQSLKRELTGRLQQSHLHLSHLVEQGAHYRTQVFGPARTVFDMTRKAYAVGEVEILALIDANDIYFDAHTRYLELLQEAWLEAAELRLAAGRALLADVKEEQP